MNSRRTIYAGKFNYLNKQTHKLLSCLKKHEDDNRKTRKTEEKSRLLGDYRRKRTIPLELLVLLKVRAGHK